MILIVFNGCWLLMNLFTLPGNWLMLMSTCFFAWWRAEDNVFSVYTLVAIALLAVLGEVAEFFGGVGGAKRAGAGWKGSIGAVIGAITGAIAGTFVLPLFGTFLGACIGAGLGAWVIGLFGGHQMRKSFNFGIGAGVGQFIGILSKFAVGAAIWTIITVAAFCP